MPVLNEILKWSQERPVWQRDALRRLVLNNELSEDDLQALEDWVSAIRRRRNQRMQWCYVLLLNYS